MNRKKWWITIATGLRPIRLGDCVPVSLVEDHLVAESATCLWIVDRFIAAAAVPS